MVITSERARFAGALLIGLGVSTASPLAIAASVAIPAIVLKQRNRGVAYQTACAFYAGALWPLIPGARNFFGPDASDSAAVALWATAVLLLSVPWALVWAQNAGQAIWRAPLGMALTVIPPLGIIGWASPLTASGILFPGFGWAGLVFCAVLSGSLAIRPRTTLAAAGAVILAANLAYRQPAPLTGWEGVDTDFGGISDGRATPLAEYRAAERIQERALSSAASVIVFPETVVPVWNAATDAFWQPTLRLLQKRGKTIVVGARLPTPSPALLPAPASPTDFSNALAVLDSSAPRRAIMPQAMGATGGFPYQNSVIIRGASAGVFQQRIPVPIAMWNPAEVATASMNLFGPAVVEINGKRAAILVCYEQTLVWPMLGAVASRPAVLVGVANDYWATGTTIRRFQATALRSWARLLAIPYIVSVNT